jgi:hypothetical protein
MEGLHLRQLRGEIFNAPITETATIWEDNNTIKIDSCEAEKRAKAPRPMPEITRI